MPTIVGSPVSGKSASGNLVLNKTLTAGSTLILAIAESDGTGTSTCLPTISGGGGTWTQVVAASLAAFHTRASIWRMDGATAGAATITIVPNSSSDSLAAGLTEWGLLAAVDKTATGGPTFSTTPSVGPTAATVTASEVVIAAWAGDGSTAGATIPPTGYTNIANQANAIGALVADYIVVSSTGTKSAAWGTITSGSQWTTAIATFADGAATGPAFQADAFQNDAFQTSGGGATNYTLSGTAGSYTLTGQAGTLSYTPGAGSVAYSLSGATGSYTITGRAATFQVGRLLSGAVGSYTITGRAATFKVAHTLSGATGSYSYTGNAATFKVGRLLSGAVGSYAITGNAGTLTYIPGAGSVAYSLSGATGAYAITGNAATFKVAHTLSGAVGAYTLTGNVGSFKVAHTLSGAAGAYAITGRAATFKVVHTLSGATGVYAINGRAGTFSYLPGGVGSGVYPDPTDVRAGVLYGPTGTEYVGTAPANRLKRWNGTAWETNGLRSWNGTSWM